MDMRLGRDVHCAAAIHWLRRADVGARRARAFGYVRVGRLLTELRVDLLLLELLEIGHSVRICVGRRSCDHRGVEGLDELSRVATTRDSASTGLQRVFSERLV